MNLFFFEEKNAKTQILKQNSVSRKKAKRENKTLKHSDGLHGTREGLIMGCGNKNSCSLRGKPCSTGRNRTHCGDTSCHDLGTDCSLTWVWCRFRRQTKLEYRVTWVREYFRTVLRRQRLRQDVCGEFLVFSFSAKTVAHEQRPHLSNWYVSPTCGTQGRS